MGFMIVIIFDIVLRLTILKRACSMMCSFVKNAVTFVKGGRAQGFWVVLYGAESLPAGELRPSDITKLLSNTAAAYLVT